MHWHLTSSLSCFAEAIQGLHHALPLASKADSFCPELWEDNAVRWAKLAVNCAHSIEKYYATE